jgi:hypothetical protein
MEPGSGRGSDSYRRDALVDVKSTVKGMTDQVMFELPGAELIPWSPPSGV